MLIQNQQEQEASLERSQKDLEDIRAQNKAKIAEMEQRLAYYRKEIAAEDQRIQQEEMKILSERAKVLGTSSSSSSSSPSSNFRSPSSLSTSNRTRSVSSPSPYPGDSASMKVARSVQKQASEDAAVEAAAIEAALQGGLSKESAQAMGVVPLLAWLESQLLTYLRRCESINPARLKAELKKCNNDRAKERKERKTRQQNEELQRHKDEAKRRAQEPVHKKAGRQVSYRSAPKLRVKKNTQKTEETVDEDREFFFDT